MRMLKRGKSGKMHTTNISCSTLCRISIANRLNALELTTKKAGIFARHLRDVNFARRVWN